MSDWTCRCTAKNDDGSRYCEGCGGENPKTPRPLHSAPKPAEGYQYWTPPVYPDPPASSEEAKVAIAKIKALLAAKMTPP